MKLLFDENISYKLPRMLVGEFLGSTYLRNCGLSGATDDEIWDFARLNGFIVVSKDSDFYSRAILHGAPPKVIWLRIGNCSTMNIRDLIDKNQKSLELFAADTNNAILVLS